MRVLSLMTAVSSLAAALLIAQAAAGAGTLHVRITGFESTDGELAIALFANEEDYESQSNAVRRAWLEISGDETEWTVEGLSAGEYALIAYHDTNGNGEIDFRLLGMPKEPVGVSNNARGAFGPPRFEAAKFLVSDDEITRQHLRLR
jgi:uncharacterized protein (DUF2141 family)